MESLSLVKDWLEAYKTCQQQFSAERIWTRRVKGLSLIPYIIIRSKKLQVHQSAAVNEFRISLLECLNLSNTELIDWFVQDSNYEGGFS